MDDFGGYNITLNVEDESLSEIAKLASEEKTGKKCCSGTIKARFYVLMLSR